jgi:hypothetical protein
MADQIVTYSDIFAANYSVTGIRLADEETGQVLITGSYSSPNTPTKGMLYRGPKYPSDSLGCPSTGSTGCYCMIPDIEGATSSILYGPDTHLFNPNSIDEGKVRAVGSYTDGQNRNHGVLYNGPLDGSGKWESIDMDGDNVVNTILHSTMGDLIVGNYDVQGTDSGKFNAFIYNMRTGLRYKLVLKLPSGAVAEFVTAYGIWQNIQDKPYYTIAGGLRHSGLDINDGYLVDYDSEARTVNNLRIFSYNSNRSLLTHFEGITQFGGEMTRFGPRYYSLAATGDQTAANMGTGGAAFAVVERLPDGSFGEARWEPSHVGGSSINTGNTVLENNLYGIYKTSNSSGIQSYVAVVSEG